MRRLIVTRPQAQARPWVQALRACGVDAVALPLIGIQPLHDAAAVRQAWAELHRFQWVMFVSANAVEHFFSHQPEGMSWPPLLPAGAPGPGTKAALQAAGVSLIDEPVPGRADSEGLWAAVRGRDWAGCHALVVRGEDGRDWLAEQLRGAGAEVAFIAAYRRAAPPVNADGAALLAQAVANPQRHAFVFGSSEAVAQLGQLTPGADWSRGLAFVGHERIAQAAIAAGFGQVTLAPPQDGLSEGAATLASLMRAADS